MGTRNPKKSYITGAEKAKRKKRPSVKGTIGGGPKVRGRIGGGPKVTGKIGGGPKVRGKIGGGPKVTKPMPSKPKTKPKASKPVKKVKTKGGDYPVYKKGSKEAKSFREAFRAARKAGKKIFTWQGRKYNTRLKSDK